MFPSVTTFTNTAISTVRFGQDKKTVQIYQRDVHPDYFLSSVNTQILTDFVNRLFTAGSKLLDVGSGPGTYTGPLKEHYQLEACDPTEAYVAKGNLDHPDVPFTVDSLPKLEKYSNDSFDGLLLIAVLMHLKPRDYAGAVENTWRVLKPGGRVFITIPSEKRPVLTGKRDHRGIYYNNLPPQQWIRLFEKQGFRFVPIETPNTQGYESKRLSSGQMVSKSVDAKGRGLAFEWYQLCFEKPNA